MEKQITIPRIRIVEMPDYFYAQYEAKRPRTTRTQKLVLSFFGLRSSFKDVFETTEETVWYTFLETSKGIDLYLNHADKQPVKFDTAEEAKDYATTKLTNWEIYPKYTEIPEQQIKV